jgi:hypothetical protein
MRLLVRETTMSNELTNRVSVTDVDMPFLSMVRFMVKWAVASIPALLILAISGAVCWGVLLGFFAGLGSNLSRKTPDHGSSGGSDPALSSPAADPAVAAYLSKIEVQNVEVSKTTLGDSGVFGEVKNTGDRSLKAVEITVYCLDSDGKAIFEKLDHPVLVSEMGFGDSNQPLKPGYSRQFGVRLRDAPSEWSKKVDVKVTSLQFE